MASTKGSAEKGPAKSQSEQQAEAVAAFVERGGKVEKLQDAIPVSGPDVVAYLATCGITVKQSSGAYLHARKRLSLAKLVELANVHRRAENLPPFAATIQIRIGRRS